jgi:hypothetical protein
METGPFAAHRQNAGVQRLIPPIMLPFVRPYGQKLILAAAIL